MKNILLLEDEETLGGLYKKQLEKAGNKVMWAKTTEEAEETIKKFKADIIFLDQSISGEKKSGLEIIPDLKKALPKTKIIMLTNYSSFQFEKKSKELGAEGYLLKIDTPPAVLAEYVKKM